MAICAFDILADGTAREAPDLAPEGPEAYRWLHFSLEDPGLPDWIRASLPAIPGQALLQSETRPRCDAFGDGIILNLRGVNLNPGAEAAEMVSLRMWVTARTIVTVRMRRVFALDDIRRGCAAGEGPASAGLFVARLVEGLALRARDAVLELTSKTEALEELIEDGGTPKEDDLRQPRRRVLKFRRYIDPQSEALDQLQQLVSGPVTPAEQLHLREAANLVTLSAEALESLNGRLAVVQDHMDAQLARQLGRNSYALSVVAAVFLPLSFVTGLFGVNLGGIPGTLSGSAFGLLCLALLAMGAGAAVLLRWFRLL